MKKTHGEDISDEKAISEYESVSMSSYNRLTYDDIRFMLQKTLKKYGKDGLRCLIVYTYEKELFTFLKYLRSSSQAAFTGITD